MCKIFVKTIFEKAWLYVSDLRRSKYIRCEKLEFCWTTYDLDC